MIYDDLEYNEDIKVLRYPKVPYFWSIYFSVTLKEQGKVVKCLLQRETIEDHFHNDLEEFDIKAMAKIEELMEEEILPAVSEAIKNDDGTIYLAIDLIKIISKVKTLENYPYYDKNLK